jgi:hypothetical protein
MRERERDLHIYMGYMTYKILDDALSSSFFFGAILSGTRRI